MLHGEQGSVVYPFHSMKFYDLLNACGVKTELDFIVNTNHAFLLAEYMRELRAPLLAASAAFLKFIGVDEVTAADDACRIEHVISQLSFEKIREYADKIGVVTVGESEAANAEHK